MSGLKCARIGDDFCFWLIETNDLGPGVIDFDLQIRRDAVGVLLTQGCPFVRRPRHDGGQRNSPARLLLRGSIVQKQGMDARRRSIPWDARE